MYFKVDHDGKIKVPKLSLRLSGGSGLGVLKLGDKLPDCELNANDISNFKFTIYEKLDGQLVQYYDLIEIDKIIETDYIGVYRITDVEENRNGKVAYKDVTVKSLEYELKQRKIFDISGVLSLYNVADTSKSLMHIICNSLGNWSIGHIDNELTSLYRTFDLDSADAYSLLTDNLSNSFQCVFQFDTYNRSISSYTIDNFGEKVDVLLSYRNLVQQNIITSSLDDVYSIFKVSGGNDLSIRDVTPNLSDTIANFDYFMVKKSEGGNATDELVNAWNSYKTLSDSLTTTQTANISQLKIYQNELLALNTTVPSTVTTDWTQYGLTELNTKKTAYTVTQSTLLSNGAGSTSSSQYSEYLSIVHIINAIKAEILVRESQINAKQTQINNLNTTISNIANQLLYSNNFTTEQIKEIYSFYRESEYTDSSYVVADTDSEATKLEVEQQLYNVANTELARVSQPQYNIDTTLNNLFMLPEFSNYHEGFSLGNIITIKFSDTLIATARLLSMKINFNKLDDLTVVFANRNKLDNSAIDLKKIIAQANSTSNSVAVSGLAWDKAASKTSEISTYMTKALNAAVQEIKSSDKEEVTIGEWGIRLKEKNEITGSFNPEESWFVHNKLLFSTDNFNSAISGIGKFISPTNGQTYYGFLGEAIVSKINITSALTVTNENNTITLNKDGAIFINCDITITKGVNTITLNASEGIKLTKSGVNQFYFDTEGNLTLSSNITASTITASTINIGSGNFSVDIDGNVIANSLTADSSVFTNGTYTGKITATSGEIGGFSIDTTQLVSGTGDRFMRISPYSTTPGTNNYSTLYGAIDLGITSDGLDTLIHLRSDGYARFGLNSLAGSVKFNYDSGSKQYALYTSNFRIEKNGFVSASYINSFSGDELLLVGDNNVTLGADSGSVIIYGGNIEFNPISSGATFKYDGYNILHTGNYTTYCASKSALNSLEDRVSALENA